MAAREVTVTLTAAQARVVRAALALYTAHEPDDGVSRQDNATADRAWDRLEAAIQKSGLAQVS